MSDDPRAVWVTGVGLVSPLGNSFDELATRFASGESAIGPFHDGLPGFGAVIDRIPLDTLPAERRSHLGRLDRLCRLLLASSYAAIQSSGLVVDDTNSPRVGLSIGTGLGCLLTDAEFNAKLVDQGVSGASPRLFAYTVSNAAAGEVSIALGIKGPNLTAHQGLAAGLGAIGYAHDLIRLGKADVMLAGGVDALGPALIKGLDDLRLLKKSAGASAFRDRVPGLYPSEGAAVFVLEAAESAQRRRARPWARILGYSAGFEPTLTRRERRSDAIGATISRALERSLVRADQIDLVITSAHATEIDSLEKHGLDELAASPRWLSPKDAWGECFAAHGALSTALSIAETRPGQLALIHSLCYSGPTVALVLARTD